MDRFLLDTQVIIWLAEDRNKISSTAFASIRSENHLYLSYVSIWEMAIKISVGKLLLKSPLPEFMATTIEKQGLELLPIFANHIYKSAELPFHHNDPFDRLIISQAFVENLPVIGSDKAFDNYAVSRIW